MGEEPLAIDLFCGLGGWAEGFLAEGYRVIGFDNVKHDYGTGTYPGQLVLQDVLTLHGSQFKNAAVIVASPPCTEYSYMAMPWKRAKQIARALRGHGEFPSGYEGSRSIAELNILFNECFRIQREACEAMGRHIPLIVENVKGAQPWVGRAPWNFGSFYLWGDVPALMPMIVRRKVHGQNWRHFKEQGKVSAHWRMQAQKNDGGSWFNVAHKTASGCGKNPVQRIEDSGLKQVTNRKAGWFGEYIPGEQGSRNYSSNSVARARASAEIAKIPFPLAQHIARVFKAGA